MQRRLLKNPSCRNRTAHCDTDSLMFLKQAGMDNIEDMMGSGLGMFQSEVPAGYKIIKFVSTASKVYTYVLEDPAGNQKVVWKAKGVRHDVDNNSVITVDALEQQARSFAAGEGFDVIETTDETMVKRPVQRLKKLQPVMDKMLFFPDGSTRPYGWIEDPTDLIDDYLFYH
ncbi:unnamed protein product [Caenorhabditis auriculariae]|uniref:Uncharacterized protein n=1 Tax=Caenorhabditis auriculariae TaxID=2777116 RepID=A0A8S1HVP9_9PELO|nr:unnamed protein product [Caenorhabditis auriculariae]